MNIGHETGNEQKLDIKMKHCKYCAQTDTKLDEFGYCKKYDCLSRSGKKAKLENLIERARNILFIPNEYVPLGIKSWVTNCYHVRTRKANNIMYDAAKEFGFVPLQVLERIPMANREKWDKNIKW
jgi:hypothetical protein